MSAGPADFGSPSSDGVAEWRRLHPLSPLVRLGGGVLTLITAVVAPGLTQTGQGGAVYFLAAALVLGLIGGGVVWLVTRWRVEDGVLRIDSGLIRHTSKRFPLTQVQAIDTIRPLLARLFGLAELRLRMAGSGSGSGRLAYLRLDEAEALRARLLAMSRGLAEQTLAPPERILLTVGTPLLAASVMITSIGITAMATVTALGLVAAVSPRAFSATVGVQLPSFLGVFGALTRRFTAEYRTRVGVAGDGLRLRSGLIQTSAETIPFGRVQALRMVQPLLWRPFGWYRLEADVAGRQRRRNESTEQGRSLRVLLPVGTRQQAAWLIDAILPGVPIERHRPPLRARWKTPLRYRNLAWSANATCAAATGGRVRRVTVWVPLTKVQSIRKVEGPVQRRMHLASVHLDTAGRNVRAVLRDRDVGEADGLMTDLPERCRQARGAMVAGSPARARRS